MVDTKLVSELIISAQEGDEFAFNELLKVGNRG